MKKILIFLMFFTKIIVCSDHTKLNNNLNSSHQSTNMVTSSSDLLLFPLMMNNIMGAHAINSINPDLLYEQNKNNSYDNTKTSKCGGSTITNDNNISTTSMSSCATSSASSCSTSSSSCGGSSCGGGSGD